MKTDEVTAAVLAWGDLVQDLVFLETTWAGHAQLRRRVDQARRRAIRSHGIRR